MKSLNAFKPSGCNIMTKSLITSFIFTTEVIPLDVESGKAVSYLLLLFGFLYLEVGKTGIQGVNLLVESEALLVDAGLVVMKTEVGEGEREREKKKKKMMKKKMKKKMGRSRKEIREECEESEREN